MKLFLPSRALLVAGSVLVAALFTSIGCTNVQVDPNTTGEYKLGELQVFADRDFATVHAAATRALKEAKLFQTKDDRKVVEAELNGRDSSDTLVIIKIKEVGKNRTSVKIRYGVFKPDLPAAQKFYQAMEKFM
jgi:hypothetical protein